MYLLWIAVFAFVGRDVCAQKSPQETNEFSKAIEQGLQELKSVKAKKKYDDFLVDSAMLDKDQKEKRVEDTLKKFDEEEKKQRLGSECGKSHMNFSCRFK